MPSGPHASLTYAAYPPPTIATLWLSLHGASSRLTPLSCIAQYLGELGWTGSVDADGNEAAIDWLVRYALSLAYDDHGTWRSGGVHFVRLSRREW